MRWIDSEGARTFLWLVQEHRCLHCKKKFKQPWLTPTGKPFPDNVVINVEVAYHWQDTHGFPKEELEYLVSSTIYVED